jgi:hypothetical protein
VLEICEGSGELMSSELLGKFGVVLEVSGLGEELMSSELLGKFGF